MGKAQAKDLGLDGGVLYDPVSNYERVHHHLGLGQRPRAGGPTATVDTPAQDATIPDQPAALTAGSVASGFRSMRQAGEPSVEDILDRSRR
jgi:hypothetical protein